MTAQQRISRSSETARNRAVDFVNMIDVPACLVDLTGHFCALNHGMFKLTDSMGNALIGRSVFDYLHPLNLDSMRRFWTRCEQAETPELETFRIEVTLQIGGDDLYVAVRPFVSETSIIGYLCQRVSTIDSSNAGVNYLLARCDQGAWEYDVRSDEFSVSNDWRRIRGRPATGTFLSDDSGWLDDVHPDDRANVCTAVEQQRSGEMVSMNLQYRHRHRDGGWVRILSRGSAVELDDSGRVLRMVGTDTDITEIRKIQDDVSEMASKLQLAIESSGIGIWEFDHTTSSVYWDDRMLELYGLEDGQNDRSGDLWETYLHPDDLEATVAYSDECQRNNSDFNRDYRIVRRDGEVRHVRSMARSFNQSSTGAKLIGINIDVTDDYKRTEELERARGQLEFDSRHDALTGLANRRFLDEASTRFFDEVSDQGRYAVLHMDLDHFKQINDSLGHAAGDAVLRHVADTLRDFVQDAGMICRVGGDEFIVFFEQYNAIDDLVVLANAIIQACRKPIDFEGRSCQFGISVGVSAAMGRPTSQSEIFSHADMALYDAKMRGRSCVEVYSEQTQNRARFRLSGRQEILDALDRGEITCFYQPQFDAQSLAFVGAEALVRWIDAEGCIKSPAEFLPLVAQAELTARIDECVLDQVLLDQKKWLEQGFEIPRISVNVSGERIAEPHLISQLKNRIQSYNCLSFELLETAFLDSPTSIIKQNLNAIRSMGIELELDDFGSGHASIIAINSIKPTRIKIDRNLILPILKQKNQLDVLQAIIQIARIEHIKVVAEGVETPEHIRKLQPLGFDYFQGFALGYPMGEPEFCKLLTPQSDRILTTRQTK